MLDLVERVVGWELGPVKFHFRFNFEADLLLVLNKGSLSLHLDALIQRWEPVV